MQNGHAFLPNPNIVLKDALLHWLEDRKLAAKEIDYPQREAKMIEGKSVVVKLGECWNISCTLMIWPIAVNSSKTSWGF